MCHSTYMEVRGQLERVTGLFNIWVPRIKLPVSLGSTFAQQAILRVLVFFPANSVGSGIRRPGFIGTVPSVVLSTLFWKHLRRGGINFLNTWLDSLLK